MNKVILIGNLTHDPELKKIAEDKQVCKMRLAVSGYKKDDVVYVDVDAWGQLASLCDQYLAKGRKISVDGRLSLNQWETKEGEKRQKIFVIADSVEFLSPRTEGESHKSETASTDVDDDDNIPF